MNSVKDIKTKLLNLSKDNEDLRLAIAAQPDRVKKNNNWVDNDFFILLYNSFGRVNLLIKELVDDGLSYSAGDFYVYVGRGGIKAHETPKGVRKQLQRIAKQYGLNIIVSDGVLFENDRITVVTDGKIDDIKIEKNQQTLINGGTILSPYAVVTVLKDTEIIAKKFYNIPNDEYLKIVAQGQGNSYKTLMAQKSVMKRVANSIYSLLGVSMGKEDINTIDDIEDRMSEVPRQPTNEVQIQDDPLENNSEVQVIEAEEAKF